MIMLWYITVPVFGGLTILAAVISARIQKRLQSRVPWWLFLCQALALPFLLAFFHAYVVDRPLLNPILLTGYLVLSLFYMLIPSLFFKNKQMAEGNIAELNR